MTSNTAVLALASLYLVTAALLAIFEVVRPGAAVGAMLGLVAVLLIGRQHM